jgi:hypothetical protein
MAGHLDTSGLDPATASAVELLAAVDVIAAEQRPKHVPRPLRQPGWAVAFVVLVTLVVVAWGQSRISRIQEGNSTILETVQSCVTPKGECAQRGARNQANAIQVIVDATVVATCAATHEGKSAINSCIRTASKHLCGPAPQGCSCHSRVHHREQEHVNGSRRIGEAPASALARGSSCERP